MHKENFPTFLGNIISNWLLEIHRNKERLERAKENISIGKLSGVVGNYTIINSDIEKKSLETLNLKPELFASQIVSRDRYAEVISCIGMLASSYDRIAINVTILLRHYVVLILRIYAQNWSLFSILGFFFRT